MGNSEYVVQLTLTKEGTQAFADATTKAYEAGETIAIYYDGEIISAPNVQSAITDGNAVITGQSSLKKQNSLLLPFVSVV